MKTKMKLNLAISIAAYGLTLLAATDARATPNYPTERFGLYSTKAACEYSGKASVDHGGGVVVGFYCLKENKMWRLYGFVKP